MDTTEKRIEELQSRPPTAENLNALGDLYFRTGNKLKAITCYYDSIEKLHYGQKEKQIAIYKKIIRSFPNDVEAYEGIAALYKRMGLSSEEIEYLSILAHICQNQGNYNRALSAAKRIRDLDPENQFARKLLDAEHDVFIEKKLRDASVPAESPLISSSEPTDNSSQATDTSNVFAPEAEEPVQEKEGITYSVKDRSDTGIFTATLEEVVEEKKPEFVFEPEKNSQRLYLVVGAIFVLLVIGTAAVFLFRGKFSGMFTPQQQDSGQYEQLWIDNSLKVATSRFEINVTRITDKMFAESGLSDSLSQQDISGRQFYSLSVKALHGCLPGEFVSSPYTMISFVGKDGALHAAEPLAGTQNPNKFVFKANACNQDFGAVFGRIFVYHMNDSNYNGMTIRQLEGEPVTVKWK